MSGDVQPRKRKDKRRKRDDDDAGTPPPTLINPSADHSTDNVTIHVHKDGGTGGHWCARIIFFALFTALIGLVGVIILEHRGTTDVDTPVASSQWAAIFEGWVDDISPEHDEPESEETDKSEEDEHGDEEAIESEELEELEEEEESEETASEEDPATNEESAQADEATEEQIDSEEEADEGYSDNDDEAEEDSEDVNEEDESQEAEEEDEDDSDHITNVSGPDLDVSIEGITVSSKEDEDEGLGDDSQEAEDNSEELEEDEDDEEGEEDEDDTIDEEEAIEKVQELEEESTSVAVKFGVGVALIVTAHFVLVRRWNNVDIAKYPDEEVQDLSRRNTIIPPGNPKQQSFQELKEKYRDLPIETVASKNITSSAMKNTFLKSKEQDLLTSESERCSGTEQESDYDEGDHEDEEYVEDEEEEEEEKEGEGVEEVDDSELVAKLEAKYGKLPTPSQSEESEEAEESEEYSEDEVDDWKRVNVPKATENVKRDEKPREVPKSQQGSSRGGYQETANISHDFDELIVQEDVDNLGAEDS